MGCPCHPPVQALGRRGWLHLSPLALGCLHPCPCGGHHQGEMLPRGLYERDTQLLWSTADGDAAALPQLPDGFSARGGQREVLCPSFPESTYVWDSDAEYTMVAILLDREGFNICGVCGRERGKSNRNAAFIFCAGTDAR